MAKTEKKPVTKKPVVKKTTAAKKPVTKKPVTKKPVKEITIKLTNTGFYCYGDGELPFDPDLLSKLLEGRIMAACCAGKTELNISYDEIEQLIEAAKV